ncbi:MAG: hypothetical protein ACPL1G_05500 [Thermodesulfovibrionales bacterium]
MKNLDKRYLEILLNKPELIVDFPEWMLPSTTIEEIMGIENFAIAEIAGRDSIAAVISAYEMRTLEGILPTIAYTGTEYGNWDLPFEGIYILKEKIGHKVKIYSPIILGSPRFWWTLCGRYSVHFFKKFGFYSQCIGCHLYFHVIRVPLSKKLKCKLIIGGERESHNGRIKINQIKTAIDAYTDFLKRFEIELFLPLRNIKSGERVESIIGQRWNEGEQQLNCVLNKNYQEMNGSVSIDTMAIQRFFDEFAFEAAEKFIRSYI